MTGGNVYKKDFNFDQISATTYKVMSAIRYILSICCNREPMLLKTYNVIAFFEYVRPISVVDEIKLVNDVYPILQIIIFSMELWTLESDPDLLCRLPKVSYFM